MAESQDEIQTRHKKELKALDGEKRAAVKKAKTTAGKGKKAKDAVTAVEEDYDVRLKELQKQHDQELQLSVESSTTDENGNKASNTTDVAINGNVQMSEDQIKIVKARKKREKQRENKRLKEEALADELANAGPSPRDVENDIITQQLTPLALKIKEVLADGNCMYRAVAANCEKEYSFIRGVCADTLEQNEADFAPFCEFTEKVPDYAAYVDQVRHSAEWGGHLELRALAIALRRPIVVYSAQSRDPLVITEVVDDENPIRLSYHLSYYSLGEHYNQVVEAKTL